MKDRNGLNECGSCGRYVEKIWRVHKLVRYCSTCYAREFKNRPCPGCGVTARLLVSDLNSLCDKCENDSPCIRCGKIIHEIGRLTEYGPTCRSCARYFTKPEKCESCGVDSFGLSRDSESNSDLKICSSCRSKKQAVCARCSRSRLLYSHSDGSMQCKKCLTYDDLPCSFCGNLMPAGRGNKCENCYWSNLLERRAKINSAGFVSIQFTQYFISYSEWLLSRVGAHKAAISINKYYSFFSEVESAFRCIPDYAELLKKFSADGLRRSMLPVKWMIENHLLIADEILRDDDSEQRRIAKKINYFGDKTKNYDLINSYYKHLLKKKALGKTSLKSIRLSLTPAIGLLGMAVSMGYQTPNQTAIDTYLIKKPGQRAAISGFVGYLIKSCEIDIYLPDINFVDRAKRARKKLEEDMVSFLTSDHSIANKNTFWISLALAYFHNLPRMRQHTIETLPIGKSLDGLLITINDVEYWIPQLPVLEDSAVS